MGHRSRSTLPSNYIHLWDDNRNIDVSTIKGNVSDDLKRLGQAAWDFFVSTEDKSFGANIGQRLKFAEMNIWGEKGLSYAETVCYITIDKGIISILSITPYSCADLLLTQDLCNIFGTLHGACAAYIVDQYVF